MLVRPSDPDIFTPMRKELKIWEKYRRTSVTSLQTTMLLTISPVIKIQESRPHRVPSVELDEGPVG